MSPFTSSIPQPREVATLPSATAAPIGAKDRKPTSAKAWVAIARSLAPLVESEVPQAARDTIITPRVVQAWKDAGLYGVLLPEHLGGAGIDDVTYLEIAEEIARQDASAGWVYANHQTGTIFPGILLPEEAFRELIGPNGDGIACGSGSPTGPYGKAKRVEGGYLVQTGPRPFGSGSQYADRVVARVALVDDNDIPRLDDKGEPIVVFIWVDRKNVEWQHDWNASGLAGSGSGSYRVIPHVLEEKWMALETVHNFPDDPVFNQGFWQISGLHHSGIGLGLAKRILEEIAKSTHGRRRGTIPALDEYPLFQADFVRIESLYQSARAFVFDAYREVWSATIEGRLTEMHSIRVDQAALYLTRVLEDILSTASLWAGSDVIPKDGIFARLNANARVAMNHLLVGPQQAVHLAPPLLEEWRGHDGV